MFLGTPTEVTRDFDINSMIVHEKSHVDLGQSVSAERRALTVRRGREG